MLTQQLCFRCYLYVAEESSYCSTSTTEVSHCFTAAAACNLFPLQRHKAETREMAATIKLIAASSMVDGLTHHKIQRIVAKISLKRYFQQSRDRLLLRTNFVDNRSNKSV